MAAESFVPHGFVRNIDTSWMGEIHLNSQIQHIVRQYCVWMQQRNLRPLTQEVYLRILRFFFLFLQDYHQGPVTQEMLQTVTLQDVRSFLTRRAQDQQVVRRQRQQRGHMRRCKQHGQESSLMMTQMLHNSGSSQGVTMGGVRAFFRFCTELIPGMGLGLQMLRAPKARKPLPRPLPQKTLHAFLTHIRHEATNQQCWQTMRNYAVLLLLYATGLRIHEALSLRWHQWTTLSPWVITVNGKGGKVRSLPVLPVCQASIGAYVQLCPFSHASPQDPLFFSAKGRPLYPKAIQEFMRRMGCAYPLPHHATPHSMRHSFASHVLENGLDVRNTQELLGHASVKTTQSYIHLSPQYMQSVLRTLQEPSSLHSGFSHGATTASNVEEHF